MNLLNRQSTFASPHETKLKTNFATSEGIAKLV